MGDNNLQNAVNQLIGDLDNERRINVEIRQQNERLNQNLEQVMAQNANFQTLLNNLLERLNVLENNTHQITENNAQRQVVTILNDPQSPLVLTNNSQQAYTVSQNTNAGNNLRRRQNDNLHANELRTPQPQSRSMQTTYTEEMFERLKPSVRSLFKFNGKPNENIDDWIFSIELYFDQAKMHPNDKLNFSLAWLRDNARATYINNKSTIKDWNDLKNFLIKRYQKSNLVLRKTLHELKQRGSIQDYIFQFEEITNQLKDEIQETDKMYHFLNGLHYKTRERVEISNPKTLRAMMEEAIRLDLYEEIKQSKLSRYKDQTDSSEDNEQTNNESIKINHVKCWYCNQEFFRGHRCLNKTNTDSESDSNSDNEYEQAYSVITNPKTLIKVDGQIGNINLKCIIDCGSSRSIISSDIVRRFNIPISSKRVKLGMANGYISRHKTTNDIAIMISNKLCKTSFVITNIKTTDVLLGMDWLTQNNVVIYPATKSFQFSNDKAKIHKEEKVSNRFSRNKKQKQRETKTEEIVQLLNYISVNPKISKSNVLTDKKSNLEVISSPKSNLESKMFDAQPLRKTNLEEVELCSEQDNLVYSGLENNQWKKQLTQINYRYDSIEKVTRNSNEYLFLVKFKGKPDTS